MKGIIGAIVGNSVGRQYAVKPTKDYNFEMNYDKTNAQLSREVGCCTGYIRQLRREIDIA